MKKIIKLLFLLLIIILIIVIYKTNYNKHINYTSIGDGLSLGVNSYGNVDYGYSDYIKDYFEKKDNLNIYVKEFSYKDVSIKELKSIILIDEKVNYKNKKINIKQILTESDILTMSIGLNDLIYKMSILNNTSTHKINQIINKIYLDFESLIQEIRKYYKKEIYLIGYYQSNKFDYKINYAITELNKKYKNTKDITYIDTDCILGNNSRFFKNSNSYYPNFQGYQAISSKIIAKIEKKLEK